MAKWRTKLSAHKMNLLGVLLVFNIIGLVIFIFLTVASSNSLFIAQLNNLNKNPVSDKVVFHQAIVEQGKETFLDLHNYQDVFTYVFSQLPNEVTIYPSENYYYFTFYHKNQFIKGNIRLDVEGRKQGKISFAYFSGHVLPENKSDLDFLMNSYEFQASDGVSLAEENPLKYRVSYGGKTVVFNLNNISQELPPGYPLYPEEKFVARTFDESGWPFSLLFDQASSQFRFIADNAKDSPEQLHEIDEHLWLGRQSGFAFYKDKFDRYVLVGVSTDQTRQNSYYDGPFDQLADNFVIDDNLKELMEQAYPYVTGKINRYGIFVNEQGVADGIRLALTPYNNYESYDWLRYFVAGCKEKSSDEKQLLACLTYDYKKDVPASTSSQ